MKTLLSAVALSGLLLAASAGNPAAATEDHRRDAPVGVAVWSQAQASSQTELRYIHDNDDDDDDWRYNNNRWPNNNWNNNGNNGWNGNWSNGWNGNWNNGWNGNWNNGWNGNWNNGWNNNWNNYGNNQWPHYQNQNYGRPLPERVIVLKLRQHHFYNVQKIKAKKGYYRVYAYDRWRRPVEVIMDPYSGRILRVGPR